MPTTTTTPAFDLADPATLVLDLNNPKPKEVAALQDTFNEAMRTGADLGPLPVHEGWNEITPAAAINLLLRNRPGANRRLDAGRVFYYAHQMALDDWKPTGQPVIVSSDDLLVDAQHRLYGVVISGATIKSYVVTGVAPGMYAYIDNGGPRTARDALQTAGFNGVASVIVNVIKLSEKVKHGVFNHSGATRLQPFSPADVLRLVPNHPNAQEASKAATSDWVDASDLLSGRKDAVAYVGMCIIDQHDRDIADDFFENILHVGEGASEYSTALHREVARDANSARGMQKHETAAMLIRLFNLWHRQASVGRGRAWMGAVREDFPTLDVGSLLEAAE